MIDMKLTRQYFDVKSVVFGEKCAYKSGILTVNEEELKEQCMELIYQGMDKKEIIQLVEEIMEELKGGGTDD